MEVFILCLVLASIVCEYVTFRKLWDRFYDEIDELQDQDASNFEAYGELDEKIRNECNDLDAKIEKLKAQVEELKKQVAEIPVEQLQAVYDSEKQFQDGLNSILNYYGPRGDDK